MGKGRNAWLSGLGPIFKLAKFVPGLKELTQYVIQPLFRMLVVEPLLWLMNWNMDPAAAYKNCPPERRSLTVVKPKSKGTGVLKSAGKYFGVFKENNGDKVIPVEVSLLQAQRMKRLISF